MSEHRFGSSDEQVRDIWRARFLDLRCYIAALFLIFGVLVTVTGAFASPAEIAKAQGVNISLWTGVSMLILSGIFAVWLMLAPPEVPEPASEADVLANDEEVNEN